MIFMRNRYKFPILLAVITLLITSVITGCEQKKSYNRPSEKESTSVEQKSYNVSDIAVVVKKDAAEGRISLRSSENGAVYSVNYNGGTKFKSKYGNDILVDKVEVGMVVEAHYIEGTRKLVELFISDEAWENTMAVNWDVDYTKKIITIGASSYGYDDNIFICSDGKEIDIREVSGIDELTVRGLGTRALSVVVDKGHGYIRLKDEDNYLDGIIEIGTRIMTKVTADMIIAAPEGEYTLVVSKNGYGGEKKVTVKRGFESVVSFADFEQPVERMGSVNFIVTPDDAKAILYVDGVQTDYKELVRISYGDHTIVFTSNNYDTFKKDVTISSAYTTINVDMADEEETKESETLDDSKDENDDKSDKDEKETTKKDDNKSESEKETINEELDEGDEVIKVLSPEGAQVYFDGTYKGIAPVEFKKQAGEHVIILRLDGYETKMYTIDVVSDGEDMEINLPAMLETDDE